MRLCLQSGVVAAAAVTTLAFQPATVTSVSRSRSWNLNHLLTASTLFAALQDDNVFQTQQQQSSTTTATITTTSSELSRRQVFSKAMAATAATTAGLLTANAVTLSPQPANAVGPTKINLLNPTYTALPCPKDKPIPGEKAMKGMRGLCVTVNVDLEDAPDKELEKVGVYGFITDKGTGESVLANNPDLSTDAGQFAMIESVKPTDKKIQFEFIAAVPREMDVSQYDTGIAPLNFKSLRVISYPGGQQYGAINPCEMNEFSDECEAWEAENGTYQKEEYMVKSNPRTKGG